MKKKLIAAMVVATLAVSMVGCGESIVENADTVTETPTIFERHTLDDCYSILVDKETGVCYLEYDAAYQYAIEVMLNPDGTPKIWKED